MSAGTLIAGDPTQSATASDQRMSRNGLVAG
jgi:hypothetical protein